MPKISEMFPLENGGIGVGYGRTLQAIQQDRERIEPTKYSGNIWAEIIAQKTFSSDWLGKSIRLLQEPADTVKVKKDELQRRYGDAIGYNFHTDMSDERAKFLIDEYETQLRYKDIAENFGGDSTFNAFTFGAVTLAAGVPSAILEEIAVLGLSAGVGAVTAGVGAIPTAIGATSVLWARRIFKAAEAANSVLKPIHRVLDSGSDLYKGTKFLIPKETLHGSVVVNGLSSLVNAGVALQHRATLSEAARIGGEQFVTGLALAPTVHYAGKYVIAPTFYYPSKGVKNAFNFGLDTVKAHLDKLDRNDPVVAKGIDATNKIDKATQNLYTPERVAQVGDLLDTVVKTGEDIDTSKSLLAHYDATIDHFGTEGESPIDLPSSVVDQALQPTADQALQPTADQALQPTVDQALQPTADQAVPEVQPRTDITADDQPITSLHDFRELDITNPQAFDSPEKFAQLHNVGEYMGEFKGTTEEYHSVMSSIADKFDNPKAAMANLLEGLSRSVDLTKVDFERLIELVKPDKRTREWRNIRDTVENKKQAQLQEAIKSQEHLQKPVDFDAPEHKKSRVADRDAKLKGKKGAKEQQEVLKESIAESVRRGEIPVEVKSRMANIFVTAGGFVDTSLDVVQAFKADFISELQTALDRGDLDTAERARAEATKEFISDLNDEDAASLMTALGEETSDEAYIHFLECLRSTVNVRPM